MKAAVVTEPDVIVIQDVPEPEIGEYDALCELLYGATCSGTDSHIIHGRLPFASPFPTIFGHESVGRVVKLGSKVRHFREGDLVTRVGTPPAGGCTITWGGFAQYGLALDHWAMCADGVPESEWQNKRVNQVLPPSVDPRVAPMFTTWRETLSYITRMGLRKGTSVLIVGSGGNGLSYAAHAALLGASVIAMVGSAGMEKAARQKAGVELYFDYKDDDTTAAINEAHPEGFDFIIDAVGQVGVADKVIPCLKAGGRYGTYGIDDLGKVAINPRGGRGDVVVHHLSYDEAETHQQICELVLQGRLKADLWYDIENAYPLDRIANAFEDVWARKTVKALVKLQG